MGALLGNVTHIDYVGGMFLMLKVSVAASGMDPPPPPQTTLDDIIKWKTFKETYNFYL